MLGAAQSATGSTNDGDREQGACIAPQKHTLSVDYTHTHVNRWHTFRQPYDFILFQFEARICTYICSKHTWVGN